jgi:hypothetical protein
MKLCIICILKYLLPAVGTLKGLKYICDYFSHTALVRIINLRMKLLWPFPNLSMISPINGIG